MRLGVAFEFVHNQVRMKLSQVLEIYRLQVLSSIPCDFVRIRLPALAKKMYSEYKSMAFLMYEGLYYGVACPCHMNI